MVCRPKAKNLRALPRTDSSSLICNVNMSQRHTWAIEQHIFEMFYLNSYWKLCYRKALQAHVSGQRRKWGPGFCWSQISCHVGLCIFDCDSDAGRTWSTIQTNEALQESPCPLHEILPQCPWQSWPWINMINIHVSEQVSIFGWGPNCPKEIRKMASRAKGSDLFAHRSKFFSDISQHIYIYIPLTEATPTTACCSRHGQNVEEIGQNQSCTCPSKTATARKGRAKGFGSHVSSS